MRILVATDGSECAGVAVDLVATLDWPTGSTIHVVEAVASGMALFGGPWPPVAPVDTAAVDDDIREQAERDLETAAERLAGPGRSVETAVAVGRAADVILALAEQTDVELIVLGSRGHGTLETMLLGSVSAEVVDHAHVPVLVARGPSVDRVIYAWDGSSCAEQAARVLTDWGLFATTDVQVLSVADAEPPWWMGASIVSVEVATKAYERSAEPSRRQHDQLAKDMADRLRKAGLKAVPERRIGDPAEQIVRVAKSQEADLVVLGTHGRSGLARLLMGSVARNVLLHAPCSVLVVRERSAHEEVAPGIA
ncbi:MAG: universal stress protein [Chloroflexota bacterium]|nr:universal stress protein [Chloroflexota bacterium]